MDISVLSQPYRESQFSGESFLAAALGDEAVTSVIVITAWLRESGVRLLVPGFDSVRARNGRVVVIFGVDLRGTTRQGVELARAHVDEMLVVHDPSGRTFHPKMYLATGADVGYALIGSNNLTAGGLWHNYEAGLTAIFNPGSEPEIAAGIDDYATRLRADQAICKVVTEEIIQRLIDEGWLSDEAQDRRRDEDRPIGSQPPRQPAGERLFTASGIKKRERPVTGQGAAATGISRRRRRRIATAPDSWWKPLGAGDAQHPEVGNPTGNVALTHVPPEYDRARFFRDVFFGSETWGHVTEDGRRSEIATVTAEVVIDTDDLGERQFEVVYRGYRVLRGRATTVLRWGDLLANLHQRDVTGWYLLIERGGIGRYRLSITPDEPG